MAKKILGVLNPNYSPNVAMRPMPDSPKGDIALVFSLLLLLYNFRGGKRKFDTLCGCVESSGPTTWQQHTEYNFTTTVTKCHIWVFLKCKTVIVTLRVSDWQWESDLGGTRNSCDVFDNDDNLIIMMRMTTTMMMIVTTWFTLIFLSSFRYSRAWSFMRPIVLYCTDQSERVIQWQGGAILRGYLGVRLKGFWLF